MDTSQSDKLFTGSIPKLYEEYLVPLIFAPSRKISQNGWRRENLRACSKSPLARVL